MIIANRLSVREDEEILLLKGYLQMVRKEDEECILTMKSAINCIKSNKNLSKHEKKYLINYASYISLVIGSHDKDFFIDDSYEEMFVAKHLLDNHPYKKRNHLAG